jgi:hypothetical protein
VISEQTKTLLITEFKGCPVKRWVDEFFSPLTIYQSHETSVKVIYSSPVSRKLIESLSLTPIQHSLDPLGFEAKGGLS